jgi:hypothetical protein
VLIEGVNERPRFREAGEGRETSVDLVQKLSRRTKGVKRVYGALSTREVDRTGTVLIRLPTRSTLAQFCSMYSPTFEALLKESSSSRD